MNGAIALPASAQTLVSPSILAANFAALGEEIAAIDRAAADLVHIDVMDGHFVPNISIGPPVVKSLRPCTTLTFDVHLMISHPDRYLEAFVQAGANHITIHVESEGDTAATLQRIRDLGCSAGLTLRPATPVETLEPFLDQVAMVLVMTVEPGFGGQSFMPDMLDKVNWLRRRSERSATPFWIEVDGGIDAVTAPLAIAAGANVLVAGTSVFRHPQGHAHAIASLRSPGGRK